MARRDRGLDPDLRGDKPACSRPRSEAGYTKVKMDPHEDLNFAAPYGWVGEPALKTVEEYLASVMTHPNPPVPNITQFDRGALGRSAKNTSPN